MQAWRHYWPWILAWCALSAAGAAVLARLELQREREAFETDARIAHRLLSQRVVQHDAVLAMLALLQPAADGGRTEQRLPAVYPQILRVQRRDAGQDWSDPRLQAAEQTSRSLRRPAAAEPDLARGSYQLVLASEPASFALQLDLHAVVPWAEWPMAPETSPVRLTLDHQGQSFVVQPGRPGAGGWRFGFRKHLAADSQPFDVVAERRVGWGELPWGAMVAWAAAVAGAAAALLALQRQRSARQRAEELLRLGQAARLNTLGELAAGLAHELNQPLTAVSANAQAARRLLDEEPPELVTARCAMEQAALQAQRASEVVGRLRRLVEQPDPAAQLRTVDLQQAARNALYLLEPELKRRAVWLELDAAEGPAVQADPVALEQVIHNLLMNAVQALEQVPEQERRLAVRLAREEGLGLLTIADSGPGIAADLLPRIFEPFFSTRRGGLGLGLSLCETLVAGMGGRLSAALNVPRGAVFSARLPLASRPAAP